MTIPEYVHRLPAAPARPSDAHKGTFGSVLVIAGSQGMSGAACLAGQAALHGGAGLVTVAVPRSISSLVAMAHSSYMTVRLDEDRDGRVSLSAVSQLDAVLKKKQTSVALGPGLGQSADVALVVRHVYKTCALPLVLDADGLNAFPGHADALSDRIENAPRILTPHPGEFSRLTGLDTKTIQASREQLAVEFAQKHNVVLLLKGAATVITDGRRLAINTTGNSGMATGGSGDVLTGLIASLLAQGMSAFEAAHLGTHLHGLAGDAAAESHSGRFLTSVELLQHLDHAWQQLENSQK